MHRTFIYTHDIGVFLRQDGEIGHRDDGGRAM